MSVIKGDGGSPIDPRGAEIARFRAELAEANARTGKCGMEGHNEPCYYCGEPCNSLVGNPSRWPVALCHADEPGVVKWHHTGCVMERLAKLAEWKERHPYGEVDLDMAIEAETKYLKLRIDTLESAQIDYEAQCAAKDARIKEEFDKYCRNLTELAQVHKESCDAKDARIAELDAERALHIEAYKSMLARAERAEAAAACYARQVGSADAENANLRDAVKRAEASHEQQVIVAANYAERAERAEAHVVDLEEIVKGVHFLRKQAEAELKAMRDGNRPLPYDRDHLGRLVREAWVRWAYTQPNPKPSWLVNYDELTEPDKEADRQIGECIARWTIIGDAARAALGGMEKIDGRD